MGDTQPGSNGHALRGVIELREQQRWLRTVIYARIGDPHVVDDLLQEVLLAAVEERSAIHSPSGWLYRLAVRKSLLYRRKAGRERRLRTRLSRQPATVSQQSPSVDPLTWLLQGERAELIRTALRQLCGRDRELLMLKYTEDWSYRQMAEHLGLSHSAVESRLHRARKNLRERLARLSIEE